MRPAQQPQKSFSQPWQYPPSSEQSAQNILLQAGHVSSTSSPQTSHEGLTTARGLRRGMPLLAMCLRARNVGGRARTGTGPVARRVGVCKLELSTLLAAWGKVLGRLSKGFLKLIKRAQLFSTPARKAIVNRHASWCEQTRIEALLVLQVLQEQGGRDLRRCARARPTNPAQHRRVPRSLPFLGRLQRHVQGLLKPSLFILCP
jgi:hypothetical protein